jgi:UDP-N-acetylglucosamine 1-carboxyvinyltransferase
MATFLVEGGNSLKGTLNPQGAKNEALQVICAVLLTADDVTIENVPEISDVLKLIEILKGLGVQVERLQKGIYRFNAAKVNVGYLKTETYAKQASSLRGSVMIIGSLLARFGQGFIPQPVEAKKLKGAYMLLEEASVTGTANIVMAAVLAEGTTTIYNAACEPYLQQLCKMLVSMGAEISGIGSNLLTINGVGSLKGCFHRILPDMIEVGSFIGLAALTASEITIKNVGLEHLGIIPASFRRLGIKVEQHNDDLVVKDTQHYEIENYIDGSIMTISDAPWPGLTPDLLSVFLVVATQAKGSVLIHQKMFESRLFFVDKLIDMGAQIILCDPHRATVIGLNREQYLRGTKMTSPDIRAGIALLIAALSAKGKSKIDNIEQIDRGYENIETRLNQIGAKITRI